MPAVIAAEAEARKWRLLDRAASDHRLSVLDVRIAISLLRHFDRQPGPTYGHMSVAAATVAKGACATPRSAAASIGNLERCGYIRIVVRRRSGHIPGGAKTSIYEILDECTARLTSAKPPAASLP